jgi:hypothetical protein
MVSSGKVRRGKSKLVSASVQTERGSFFYEIHRLPCRSLARLVRTVRVERDGRLFGIEASVLDVPRGFRCPFVSRLPDPPLNAVKNDQCGNNP